MGIDPSRGFVAFPRGLTDWEWYSEPNTARLFFHLLLTSNWQEKQWHGITIHPGELVTSQSQLAKQLGLSVMQVRTAMEHLKVTGWITVKAGPKYSIVTLNNYDSIVGRNRQDNSLVTGKQQADNNNLTIVTKKPLKQSSSAHACETPETRTTTHQIVNEFESCICKLSASGKAELNGYADRLGPELVQEILSKCIDLGARSWAYVRRALAEAEAQGCKSVEEYRLTNPIGAGRNMRVDRIRPSGNDILANATRRRPLIKPEAAADSLEQNLRRLKKKEAAKEGTPDVPEP